MDTINNDKQDKTDGDNMQQDGHVYQGISVEKFINILEQNGADLKKAVVKISYKRPEGYTPIREREKK